jgi:hypothetical protein
MTKQAYSSQAAENPVPVKALVNPELSFDILVEIGKRLRQTDDNQNKLDAMKGNRFASDTMAKHAYDEYLSMQMQLSLHKAESLEGAALQIRQAINLVDLIEDAFDTSDFATQQDFRALQRLLYSAFEVIDRSAGQKLVDIVGEYLASTRLSPWGDVVKEGGAT